jgi:hypothetical protein
MSRLTSAQVIALGEYLKPDFEPATLTVPQLLGVFGYHNIRYPSPYTKAKLVQTFNQEIKPNAPKFRREKLKKENSQASDDGIVDGVTGLPLTTAKVPGFILSPQNLPLTRSQQPVQLRRSSRHASRAHSEDQSPPRPDPVRLYSSLCVQRCNRVPASPSDAAPRRNHASPATQRSRPHDPSKQ